MPTYWQKKEKVGGGTERETEIKRRDFLFFTCVFSPCSLLHQHRSCGLSESGLVAKLKAADEEAAAV